MIKRLGCFILLLVLTGFVHANGIGDDLSTHSFPKALTLSVSRDYNIVLDHKSGKLLLNNKTEKLWGKLPTELNGDYYGYLLTANPRSSDEWDIYFVKIIVPAVDKEGDIQRITVCIYRSHFASLKVGGSKEILFEQDADRFVIYGKIDVAKKLIVDGLWLRGAILPDNKIRLVFDKLN